MKKTMKTEEMKKIQFKNQPLTDGFTYQDCCLRTALNSEKNPELNIVIGFMLLWDEENKNFDTLFLEHHAWNTSKDGKIIYDDFNIIKELGNRYNFKFRKKIKDFNITTLNVDQILKNVQLTNRNIFNYLDPILKSYEEFDAVYIPNIAFERGGMKKLTEEDINNKISYSLLISACLHNNLN